MLRGAGGLAIAADLTVVGLGETVTVVRAGAAAGRLEEVDLLGVGAGSDLGAGAGS